MNTTTQQDQGDAAAWLRVRFAVDVKDYRPIKWPPVGPYWCSGVGPKGWTLIAYVRTLDQITEYWPEAVDLDPQECDSIVFTDRFPKPTWWTA